MSGPNATDHVVGDAEQWVLGSMLLDGAAAKTACTTLRPSDFTVEGHRVIFEHAERIISEGKPLDLGLLVESLKGARGGDVTAYQTVGGAAYIAKLFQSTPHAANVKHYALLVRKKAKRQDAIREISLTLTDLERSDDPDIVLRRAQERLAELCSAPVIEPKRFRVLTSAELAAAEFSLEYLIKDVLVEGQPAIVGGAQKTLKTSIVSALCISLATGEPFLRQFPVLKTANVLLMSGESGMATLRETARRICDSIGRDLASISNLYWSDELPQFESLNDLDAIEADIIERQLGVVVIDPAFLAMQGADAGNLFVQGAIMRRITQICQRHRATLIICHHTKRNGVAHHEAPSLADLSWAGFSEFARQWILLARREAYTPGTGEHRLWITYGGSAGHSGLWALDIDEGVRRDGQERFWSVSVNSITEAAQQAQEQAESGRQAKWRETVEAAKEAILKAFVGIDTALSSSQIRTRSGKKGKAFEEALGELLRIGELRQAEFTATNGQTYEGYKRGS